MCGVLVRNNYNLILIICANVGVKINTFHFSVCDG